MSNKKSNCWLSLYKKIVRSTYKETNFVQQLCLTIVDKLFIALFIVAAVSGINIYQEKIKAKELFSNEIAKRRVEVISTISTRMFEWESAQQSMTLLLKALKFTRLTRTTRSWNRQSSKLKFNLCMIRQ